MPMFAVPCLFGLEGLVADEIRRLGLEDVRAETGRVLCRGALGELARLNLNLRCGERVLLLVYREDRLARQLADPAVAAMLEQAGYPPGGGPAAMLGHLRRRLEAGGGFPHEMGLFLGYPPEDVRGFWENGGRNYKYSGVWKVYSDDVEGARAAFRRYSRCRDAICKRLAGGISLVQMFRAA